VNRLKNYRHENYILNDDIDFNRWIDLCKLNELIFKYRRFYGTTEELDRIYSIYKLEKFKNRRPKNISFDCYSNCKEFLNWNNNR
jgi:hypothetical protein